MTSQDTNARRARRAARRRTEILEAAASVFAEQGFHRATTKEIAEAADIAEGTIYNYFKSKDDLLLGILDHMANLGERREVMDQALQEDFRTFLNRFLTERLAVLRDNHTLLAAALPEVLSSAPLRERYNEMLATPGITMLEQHLAAREELQHVDVMIAARLLSALLLGLEVLTLAGEDFTEGLWADTPKLANVITAFTFDGLGGVLADGDAG